MFIFKIKEKYKYIYITWYSANNYEDLIENQTIISQERIEKKEIIHRDIKEYLANKYMLDKDYVLVMEE